MPDPLDDYFWIFDALHKDHYRDVDPKLAGPMSRRDAFKTVLRAALNDARLSNLSNKNNEKGQS